MRFIFKLLLASWLLLFLAVPVFAQDEDIQENFDISATVRYQVLESGNTNVSQTITILNKSDFTYIPAYSVSLSGEGISNIQVTGEGGDIPFTAKDSDGRKIVTVNFSDKTVGKGKRNIFTFSYTSSTIAKKTGSVWRVYIPAVSKSNSFSSYRITVDVPRSFGPANIIKPAIRTANSSNHFEFTRDELKDSGISLTFGEKQIYNFSLTYNLDNKNVVPVRTEIALPPNTAYQKVTVEDITPRPENVYKDEDGNYLATYVIPTKTKLKVVAQVTVTSYASPTLKTEPPKSLDKYLESQKFWDKENPEIQKLAKEYNTPEKIYNFVVNTLSYSREKSTSENKRLGSVEALKNPDYAVCLEFTDLFIAMARAAGIPARAVEGYAYTSDEHDQPLSVGTDILHAWPEYFDKEQKKWIMVDPTWGNTTQGVDYFHDFDFDHVAFVINGVNSEYPVPAGGYKSDQDTKDIEVTFGVEREGQPISYKTDANFPSVVFSNASQGKLRLINTSGIEINQQEFTVFLDGEKNIEVSFSDVPPYGTQEVSVSLQNLQNVFSFSKLSHIIEVKNEKGETVFQKSVYILPVSYWVLIGGGIFVSVIIISIIAFKTGGLSLPGRKK